MRLVFVLPCPCGVETIRAGCFGKERMLTACGGCHFLLFDLSAREHALSSPSLLGNLHHRFCTLFPSVRRITVGSMTLFLEMKFLESRLLQSVVFQDDLFFFFLSLPMFISLDPNT